MSATEPKGGLVTSPPAQMPDPNIVLRIDTANLTSSVTLVPLSVSHAEHLYTNLGGLQNDHLYTYMPDGPFHTSESLTAQVHFLLDSKVFFPYVIFSSDTRHLSNQSPQANPDGTPIGIICLMNIVPHHRTIEIGHVLFASTLQRTTAATEACYLLMKYAFEELGYMRVEWKTNSFNEPSKRAAVRLGFVFEGVFRKHMVIKGRRRDTAWFSVTDDEWFGREIGEERKGVKCALEGWLDESNFDEGGGQRRKVESFREGR